MDAIITIGLDLAKSIFQIHGTGSDGRVLIRRLLRRGEVLKCFEGAPACLVGMEACGTGIIGNEIYRRWGIR